MNTLLATPPNPQPAAVQVVEASKANPLELMQIIIAPLLGPLGTAALVLLLVIFMLLQREDLRSRLIRLIGQGWISAATKGQRERDGSFSVSSGDSSRNFHRSIEKIVGCSIGMQKLGEVSFRW